MAFGHRTANRMFVVMLAALALCGVAAAASTDPQIQIVAADQAWADSIVLTASDVGPGWTADSSSGGGTSGGSGGGGSCVPPDESDLTITGVSDSGDFERNSGSSSVSSTAMVWQTSDQAQADWDRNVQPTLLTCLAASIASVKTKQFSIAVTGKRQLAYPAVAPRTAAYRVSYVYKFTVKVKKRRKIVRVPATFDFIALGNGRATAMLVIVSLNTRPLTDSYKQSLATRVAERMGKDPNPTP